MKEFWQGLGASARTSLVGFGLLIVLATALSAWWLLRVEYGVLFSDLKPQDSAVMTAELDKLKVPYRVEGSEASATLLVDKAQVHTTRLKLMGKNFSLHGAVGFELFNNTDFGMTEFAQKINYQRALQGELTRTILALSEIQDVRVHLALPEQGLFKQSTVRPKAAITVTLREGKSLLPEQVNGIQRLVAAATPSMSAQDVTVVNKQGIALTRTGDDNSELVSGVGAGSNGGNLRLDLKKATEAQLIAKLTSLLDKTFGPGQALASVDVSLNMDQVRITTEDVLPGASRGGDSKGVMVKERETVRDTGLPPLDAARVPSAGSSSSTQREADYQVGRRVEQVVGAIGAIRRLHVVTVVRQSLTSNQEDQLRKLLTAAAGASLERGDTVVVQSLLALATANASFGLPVAASDSADDGKREGVEASGAPKTTSIQGEVIQTTVIFALGALILGVASFALFIFVSRPRATQTSGRASNLSPDERQAVLAQVQNWMHQNSPGDSPIRVHAP